MKTLPTEMTTEIAGRTLQITELFEFRLRNGNRFYYTSHNEDILWGEQTYTALPIQRESVKQGANLEPDTVRLAITNITSDIADEVEKGTLDGMTVVIKRIVFDGDAGIGGFLPIFAGIADISYSRSTIVADCTSLVSSLNYLVPKRVYQEPCNYRLGDANCGVDRDSFKVDRTVNADATDRFTLQVPTLGADYTEYVLGEVEVTGGDNDGQKRMIRAVSVSGGNSIIQVTIPFRVAMANNDTVKVYKGCDKRPETCKDVFGNEDKFSGFIYIPRPEEAAT